MRKKKTHAYPSNTIDRLFKLIKNASNSHVGCQTHHVVHQTRHAKGQTQVYETQNPLEGWNGKINAQLAEKGTYVWYCRYTLEGLPQKLEKGIIELIR